MKRLVRAALCLTTIAMSTGCYCCRQDYNPHTGMNYQCRQFGISLFKKECCKKEGPGFDDPRGCQRDCEHGACGVAPGVVEGPYFEDPPYFESSTMSTGYPPGAYFEQPQIIEGPTYEVQPNTTYYPPTMQTQPQLQPIPAEEAQWQSVKPHPAPPAQPPGQPVSMRRR